MVSYLVLGLISSYFLLLSRPYGTEFRLLRGARPRWKMMVGKIFAVAVALTAIVATLLDIYNLARTPP
jgi:cytochrome c oxidase assembly factor CtaG